MNLRSRRDVLKAMGAASAVFLLPRHAGAQSGQSSDLQIQIAPVSAHTIRLSVLPVKDGKLAPIPEDGSLVQESWSAPALKLSGHSPKGTVRCGT